MAWPMLGIHLYETLMVFRLMILAKGWAGGKQVSIIFRNLAPTFVATFLEKGGLNQVIFLDLFLTSRLLLDWGSNLSWCS